MCKGAPSVERLQISFKTSYLTPNIRKRSQSNRWCQCSWGAISQPWSIVLEALSANLGPSLWRHYQPTSVATYSRFHHQNRRHSDAFRLSQAAARFRSSRSARLVLFVGVACPVLLIIHKPLEREGFPINIHCTVRHSRITWSYTKSDNYCDYNNVEE